MTSTMGRPREWNKSTHASERKGPIKPPTGRGPRAGAEEEVGGAASPGGQGGGGGGGAGGGAEGGAARGRAARPWAGPGMQFDKPELPGGWNRSEQIDRKEVDALLLSQTQRALSHTRRTLLREQYMTPMQAELQFMETRRSAKAAEREAAAVPPELAPAPPRKEVAGMGRAGGHRPRPRRVTPAARRAGARAALEVRALDEWEPSGLKSSPAAGEPDEATGELFEGEAGGSPAGSPGGSPDGA